MIADIVAPQNRESLTALLATASTEVAEIIVAALDAGEGTEEWSAAEWAVRP